MHWQSRQRGSFNPRSRRGTFRVDGHSRVFPRRGEPGRKTRAGELRGAGTNRSGGSIVTASGDYTAGGTGNVKDVVAVTDSAGNLSLRDVAVTAGVSISPATPSAPTRGSVDFAASGGSGTGFRWSMALNNSRGRIDASTGAYTAGGIANVVDTVEATDSLGNTAAANISVTIPPPGGGGGCATAGAGDGLAVVLLSLALLFRRRAEGVR